MKTGGERRTKLDIIGHNMGIGYLYSPATSVLISSDYTLYCWDSLVTYYRIQISKKHESV